MSENADKTHKLRPLLTLHFGNGTEDVPRYIWDEIVLASEDWDHPKVAGYQKNHKAHLYAGWICHKAMREFADRIRSERETREVEAVAEAKAALDAATLAEINDYRVLEDRLRELHPSRLKFEETPGREAA